MESFDSDADEFQVDDDSADLDYNPNNDCDYSTRNSTASEVNDVDNAVESGALDETVRQDLSLKTVSKCKSNSKVWSYFGNMLYKKVAISKVSNKVYCKICFDAGQLKR